MLITLSRAALPHRHWRHQFVSYLVLALFFAGFNFPGLAVGSEISYPEKPRAGDYFVDHADLISLAHRDELNAMAQDLLHSDQVALKVVVIESLAKYGAGKYSIENYAARLFNRWGIGSDDRNYGILLLISKADRKARIELGADWSHDYDEDADYIMHELIIPQFKRGEFSVGIVDGVSGLTAMARNLELPSARPPWWFMPAMIGFIVVFIGVIISLFKSGRSGWGWVLIVALGVFLMSIFHTRSGSRFGGGGGFGGGFSGGGGATGSW